MSLLVQTRERGTVALVAGLFVLAVCLGLSGRAEAAGGTAMGWGYNFSGQVGTGAVSEGPCSCVPTPAPVSGVADLTEIAGGYEFGLALRSDGTVMTWGYNSSGELANGNTAVDPVPKPVAGVSGAIAVAAGEE